MGNQINKPDTYFNTKLYTGTGSSLGVTGVGFQPDLVWLKSRNTTYNHALFDNVRGTGAYINSNNTNAEASTATSLSAFDSDGFTVVSDGFVNNSGTTFASWNWLGSNTTASNTDGSITSTVSVNTTSGFSIVSYTGTFSNGTVGHGLGVAPKVIILKNRDTTNNWCMGHGSLGFDKFLNLNTTDGAGTDATARFQGTAPTSSVYYVGVAGETNGSSNNMIAYCFAEKKGFSKFGKFTSNGSDDGTFTYCGFKPAWIMMKANVTDAWSHWFIFDNKRDTYNLADLPQYANLAIQDGYYGGTPATNYSQIDMLSNGFKIRRDGNWGLGGNGTEVIYMAFAEEPLVGDNPATAR